MADNSPDMALLLDFGSVISKSLFETLPDIEAAYGLEPGTLDWRGPFAPKDDALWSAMQADEVSERGYWAERCTQLGKLAGAELEMIDVIKASRGEDPNRCIRPEAVDAIGRAKAMGAGISILSNELELFYGAEVLAKVPLFELMDHTIDATTTHILKPDPEAYRLALDAIALPPERIVFVDDQMRNIEGGRSAGFACVHFNVLTPRKSYEEALGILQTLRREEVQSYA